jgi:hypothetical protein
VLCFPGFDLSLCFNFIIIDAMQSQRGLSVLYGRYRYSNFFPSKWISILFLSCSFVVICSTSVNESCILNYSSTQQLISVPVVASFAVVRFKLLHFSRRTDPRLTLCVHRGVFNNIATRNENLNLSFKKKKCDDDEPSEKGCSKVS